MKKLLRIFLVFYTGMMLAGTALTDGERIERLTGESMSLYRAGRYEEALAAAEEALILTEEAFGPEHPNTAKSLNNIAQIYAAMGCGEAAERLFLSSISINEKALGRAHPDLAPALGNLASLYSSAGRYGEAERLLRRLVKIREKEAGRNDPRLAESLVSLGKSLENVEKYGEAAEAYERALQIREKAFGKDDPAVASTLSDLARLFLRQQLHSEAVPVLKRSIAINEKRAGGNEELISGQYVTLATSLNNLAVSLIKEGELDRAEPHLVEAVSIREQRLGPDHPETVSSVRNLSILYRRGRKYREAAPLCRRLLELKESSPEGDGSGLVPDLVQLARIYLKADQPEEAGPCYWRAAAIVSGKRGALDEDSQKVLREALVFYRDAGDAERTAALEKLLGIEPEKGKKEDKRD